MTCDKDKRESASYCIHHHRLRLVAQPEKERDGRLLHEAAAAELHELIQSLQEKELRGRKKTSDEDLPPAA